MKSRITLASYLIGCLLLILPASILGQNPVPAPKQTKSILLLNGKLHIGNGDVIENSAVAFKNGKITLVADATTIRIDNSQYDTIINLSGKNIYPGLIAMNTILGLNEIESVRATHDFSETGALNPSIRSIIAYNTDSKVIPTVRSNGVMMAQIVPKPGSAPPCISGQSSVVVLDAWNYEDATYAYDNGMHLHWPSMRVLRSDDPSQEEKQRTNTEKNIREIYRVFQEAKSYASVPTHPEKNVHLEAMRGVFDKSKKLYIHCGGAKEIISAAAFCKEFGLEMVLVGGYEAHLVTSLLKERSIPVVVTETHRLPSTSDEAIDMPFSLPYILHREKIPFALSVPEFWQVRNLSYQAGSAVAYGLPYEEAIRSITLSPAEILGIGKQTGSIELGKDATIIITSGDVLEMRTSMVLSAFIQGRQIDLDNIQYQLDRKYREKYGLNAD
jgi:imidazolonepropionase-like amidohydrolase